MKGFRFYHEFSSKRRDTSSGNVVAAMFANGVFISGGVACVETVSALFADPNSPVCGSSASLDYLRTRCKRISEAVARKIHPALFERLDADFR